MRFRREQLQVHNAIIKSGKGSTLTVTIPPKRDSFSGVSTGEAIELECFFVQRNTSNNTLEQNPNLVNKVNLMVSPLDASGDEIVDFKKVITDKAAKVIYHIEDEEPVSLSIETAKLTLPDGVTPILARIVLGG